MATGGRSLMINVNMDCFELLASNLVVFSVRTVWTNHIFNIHIHSHNSKTSRIHSALQPCQWDISWNTEQCSENSNNKCMACCYPVICARLSPLRSVSWATLLITVSFYPARLTSLHTFTRNYWQVDGHCNRTIRHLPLRVESFKLTPQFAGPVCITKWVDPFTFDAPCVHPIFHTFESHACQGKFSVFCLYRLPSFAWLMNGQPATWAHHGCSRSREGSSESGLWRGIETLITHESHSIFIVSCYFAIKCIFSNLFL